MKRSIPKRILCIGAVYMATIIASPAQTVQQQATDAASRIAAKLLRDTRFGLETIAQKEELGMQVIDFRNMVHSNGQVAYAVRPFIVLKDTIIRFGISHAASATVWVDGKEVYRATNPAFRMPEEHAYNRFLFQKYFTTRLATGTHEIKIQYSASGQQPAVFLRAQLEIGDADNNIRFENSTNRQWRLMGPFAKKEAPTVQSGDSYIRVGKQYFTWQSMPQRIIPQLEIDSSLTYFRDPYLDWNYSNGNTVWAALQVADALNHTDYRQYVKRYTGFMIDHMDYFRKQYDSLFVLRGSFHRFFRMSMLDDAGSAVLPFMDLYMTNHDESIRKKILNPVADYILHKQVRLADGTFCRPEPVAYTVWCDDLFMSVPFLLRWAKITNNKSYYDEAVQQFRGFRKYLLDPQSNLFHHGWFSTTQQRSPVQWGRANGWIAWATTELLERLPATHPAYAEVLSAFRSQMETLKQYQAASGMWHQVLDKPASFEETSCTAMFTLAIAKGVRMGWLDKNFRDAALRGWNALQTKIDADGTVSDICRGTEIGFDDNFYFTRQRFKQDPRGLGAVMVAGLEIGKMK